MKVTISNEIIDRVEEDGMVVSRIPKTNQYLYLKPESILATGEHSIVANLEPTKLYTVGEKNPEQPGTMIRGETLSKYYEYEKQYDPQEQAARRLEQQARKQTETQRQQTNNVQQAATKQTISQPVQQQPVQQQAVPQQAPPVSLEQKYSKEQFKQLKLGQKHHLDISQYWNIQLSAGQMKELRLMQENAVNIEKLGYNHPSVPVDVLEELRLGHKAGYDMSKFDWRNMSAKQLTQIRLGLEHNVDVSKYAFRAYSDAQMKQLRLGLQNGLDITSYRNPRFTDKQMYSMRCSQLFERIMEKLRDLFESVKRFLQESSLNQIRKKVMEKVSNGLERTADVISGEKSMQFFMKQQIPEETLDARINETVQDIKELLVSQELVSEEVLHNQTISEQMNTRIREAVDKLMQPENIQNTVNQEQIIEETAESVVRDAGARIQEQPMQQEQESYEQLSDVKKLERAYNEGRELTEEEAAIEDRLETKAEYDPELEVEYEDDWNQEGLSDRELFERIGEEMRMEAEAAGEWTMEM
ncbi:MAG: hypothetical protein J6B50_12790 [Lachnospiraceae bacterium]|nr:hypothetical protein [Lachnospiraceae bacterium]